VKSREGFSRMIPANICANILFSIMQKYINHGLNSRASLIKQTPSSQFSGNDQSRYKHGIMKYKNQF
jgi:hypothetical protein